MKKLLHSSTDERGSACPDTGFTQDRRSFLMGSLGVAGSLLAGNRVFASAAASPGSGLPEVGGKAMFAYVGSRTTKERKAEGRGIEVYRFDPLTGELSHIQEVTGLVNPSYFTQSADNRVLFTVHGDMSTVSSFGIDPQDGQLQLIGSQDTGGSNPVHLTLTPDGQYLIVANYATGSLATLPVSAEGVIGQPVDLVTLQGTPGPHKKQQTSSHPHQVQYDPSFRWIVSPDKGLDQVFIHRFDSTKPGLVAAGSVATREGAGPRHVAFHSKLPYLYIANELDSSVTTYRFDATSGGLEPIHIQPTLPASFVGNNTASGIFLSSDSRFLYISNRGHNSIAIFDVDPSTGLPAAVGWQSTQGKGPRFFTFDPSGNWLFAANENSHTLVQFSVDKQSGLLTPRHEVIHTGSPVCMSFTRAI